MVKALCFHSGSLICEKKTLIRNLPHQFQQPSFLQGTLHEPPTSNQVARAATLIHCLFRYRKVIDKHRMAPVKLYFQFTLFKNISLEISISWYLIGSSLLIPFRLLQSGLRNYEMRGVLNNTLNDAGNVGVFFVVKCVNQNLFTIYCWFFLFKLFYSIDVDITTSLQRHIFNFQGKNPNIVVTVL